MQSAIVKRSVVVAGHKTSVSLENEFWQGLKEIGKKQDMTLSTLVGEIDINRVHTNLSSAIRLFVFDHFRSRRTPMAVDMAVAGMAVPRTDQVGQQANGKISEHPEP